MKREWTEDDFDAWLLGPSERTLLGNKAGASRLGFAVLLKFFQAQGRFPRMAQEIPGPAIEVVGEQVGIVMGRLIVSLFVGEAVALLAEADHPFVRLVIELIHGAPGSPKQTTCQRNLEAQRWREWRLSGRIRSAGANSFQPEHRGRCGASVAGSGRRTASRSGAFRDNSLNSQNRGDGTSSAGGKPRLGVMCPTATRCATRIRRGCR